MLRTYFSFLLVFLVSKLFAQDLIINEGLKNEVPRKKKLKFIFEFDNRRSFVFNQPVKFSGTKIGAEINDIHNIGLGSYNTNGHVYRNLKGSGVDVRARFEYTTLYYQFSFLHKKKIELTIPFHLGTGRADIVLVRSGIRDPRRDVLILNEFKQPIQSLNLLFFISELGVTGQYKFNRWLGVGTGLGYRFLLAGNSEARDLFDGITYVVKLKLFLGKLVKSVNEYYSYESTYLRSKR